MASASGGVRAASTRQAGSTLWAEWTLAQSVLPAGASVVDVHTKVCGGGEGDFYEVYGPHGADEVEYEATPPAADGCWHFTRDAGTDYTVTIYVNGDSAMTIERIEFLVTFGE